MKYNYLSNEPLPTKHKYRGNVFVTTFGLDPNKNEPFNHTVDFESPNLFDSREAGIKWYCETIKGLNREGKYFLPFASPSEYIEGKHAAYSVNLSLVETSDGDEYEYVLLGEDQDTMLDTLEIEKLLFEHLEIGF
jgi:hypothetical protein